MFNAIQFQYSQKKVQYCNLGKTFMLVNYCNCISYYLLAVAPLASRGSVFEGAEKPSRDLNQNKNSFKPPQELYEVNLKQITRQARSEVASYLHVIIIETKCIYCDHNKSVSKSQQVWGIKVGSCVDNSSQIARPKSSHISCTQWKEKLYQQRIPSKIYLFIQYYIKI